MRDSISDQINTSNAQAKCATLLVHARKCIGASVAGMRMQQSRFHFTYVKVCIYKYKYIYIYIYIHIYVCVCVCVCVKGPCAFYAKRYRPPPSRDNRFHLPRAVWPQV